MFHRKIVPVKMTITRIILEVAILPAWYIHINIKVNI